MLHLPEERLDRLFSTQWESRNSATVVVDIEVEAYDRQGLLRDISDLFAKEKINVTKVNSLNKNNQAKMKFSIEIADLQQLSRLIVLLHQVPDVIAAWRHI